MKAADDLVIKKTALWINSFIIHLNICPFAKKVIENNSLKFKACLAESTNDALELFIAEIKQLNQQPEIETTLLIFPYLFENFLDYLDFLDRAEDYLLKQDYEGIYQLASFHPNYYFAGTDPDEVSNYTNRSPYPMIHILREDSVEKAISYYGNTEEIPAANIALLKQLGLDKVKEILISSEAKSLY